MITFNDITDAVCRELNTTPGDIFITGSGARKRGLVIARQMIAYFCKGQKATLHEIGRYIGRNHVTVLKGLEAFNNDLQTDKRLRDITERVRTALADVEAQGRRRDEMAEEAFYEQGVEVSGSNLKYQRQ
jgi:chromosomal replication initiation ATPase DnaA